MLPEHRQLHGPWLVTSGRHAAASHPLPAVPLRLPRLHLVLVTKVNYIQTVTNDCGRALPALHGGEEEEGRAGGGNKTTQTHITNPPNSFVSLKQVAVVDCEFFVSARGSNIQNQQCTSVCFWKLAQRVICRAPRAMVRCRTLAARIVPLALSPTPRNYRTTRCPHLHHGG